MVEKHKHDYGPVVAVKDGETVTYQACRICGAKGHGNAGVREPRRPLLPAGAAGRGK